MCEVSVVMSVYNGEEYLKECVESILNQSFVDFEFVIIDDGSTDNSKKIITSYKDERIKLISQANAGLSKALNAGITISKGKYIARIDADDIAIQNRLQLQFSFLKNNPSYVAVGSNAEIISMTGEKLYTSKKTICWENIRNQLPCSPFFHSSVMFSKDAYLKAGGYNETIKHYIEDTILWNQLSAIGKLTNLSDALIKYRLVPLSISNRNLKQTILFNTLIKNFVEKGYFENEEMLMLKSVTKPKSLRWKNSNYYQRIGKIFMENNFNKRKALLNLLRSVYYNPVNVKSYFNMVLLIMPQNIITTWKKYRIAK